MIAIQAGTTVWRWDNTEPFGAALPNDDPDGDSVPFVFNLRFPWQYFESGDQPQPQLFPRLRPGDWTIR
jgi:hypothetical protein